MARSRPSDEDVRTVFEAWRARRPKPDRTLFTTDRERLIRRRLSLGFTPDQLVAVVVYVYEADDDWCRWMRGEKQGSRRGGWLGLDNILRERDLADRVERALDWSDEQDAADDAEDRGIEAGPLGRWRVLNGRGS